MVIQMRDSARKQSRDPDAGRAPQKRPHGGEQSRRMSGSGAVQHAKAELLELTGQPAESVSSLSRTRDGWRVKLEVVELERIPHTTDILASYMVELDDEGELRGYERVNRYYRNEVGGDA